MGFNNLGYIIYSMVNSNHYSMLLSNILFIRWFKHKSAGNTTVKNHEIMDFPMTLENRPISGRRTELSGQ